MSPQRLVNLQIDEVSTVSRGAGLGVTVKLMKREGGKMTDVDIAKANMNYALAEQAHAQKMFPGDPKALSKWLATDAGKKVSAAYCRDSYETMQKANALGDGYEHAAKSDQDPDHGADDDTDPNRNRNRKKKKPVPLSMDDCSDAREDDAGVDKVAKAIKMAMAAGMNFDAAATQVLRLCKAFGR